MSQQPKENPRPRGNEMCKTENDIPRKKIVKVLSCVLRQLFSSRNDKLPDDPSLITMFHTERAPAISIESYFDRIAKYSECSAECLVLALVHINRILHYRPNFQVNSLNIHRLLLTSVMCSAKFFDDQYYNNAFYAKVGGVPTKEMNCLEVEFLAIINFDLFVDPQVYALFYRELCNAKLHTQCDCDTDGLDPLAACDIPPVGDLLTNLTAAAAPTAAPAAAGAPVGAATAAARAPMASAAGAAAAAAAKNQAVNGAVAMQLSTPQKPVQQLTAQPQVPGSAAQLAAMQAAQAKQAQAQAQAQRANMAVAPSTSAAAAPPAAAGASGLAQSLSAHRYQAMATGQDVQAQAQAQAAAAAAAAAAASAVSPAASVRALSNTFPQSHSNGQLRPTTAQSQSQAQYPYHPHAHQQVITAVASSNAASASALVSPNAAYRNLSPAQQQAAAQAQAAAAHAARQVKPMSAQQQHAQQQLYYQQLQLQQQAAAAAASASSYRGGVTGGHGFGDVNGGVSAAGVTGMVMSTSPPIMAR